MKIKRLLAILLSCLTLFCFSGCNETFWYWILPQKYYKHPEFSTKYTVEEHIEKISQITEDLIKTAVTCGEVAAYTVDILYAFCDDDPEYFMMQLEYAEPYKYKLHSSDRFGYGTIFETKYMYVIGYIENDEYLLGLKDSSNFVFGENPYDVFGKSGTKKYYGAGHYGIEEDGQILHIYEGRPFSSKCPPELDTNENQQYYVTKKQAKKWKEDWPKVVYNPGFAYKDLTVITSNMGDVINE